MHHQSLPSASPSPSLLPPICSLSPGIYLFCIFHVDRITQYVIFCAPWVISKVLFAHGKQTHAGLPGLVTMWGLPKP